MFFSKLAASLELVESFHIIAQAVKDGKIQLAITPKTKNDKVVLPPLLVTGTPEELDTSFADLWSKVEPTMGLISNIEAFTKAVTAKGKTKTATKSDDDESGDDETTTGDDNVVADITKTKKPTGKAAKEKPVVKADGGLFVDMNNAAVKEFLKNDETVVIPAITVAPTVEPAPVVVAPTSDTVVAETPKSTPVIEPVKPVVVAPALVDTDDLDIF